MSLCNLQHALCDLTRVVIRVRVRARVRVTVGDGVRVRFSRFRPEICKLQIAQIDKSRATTKSVKTTVIVNEDHMY